MTSQAELRARLRASEREVRILRGRLERSESSRRSLELLKERQETLLRQNLREIALAKEAVVRANADLERRVAQRTEDLSASNLALTHARDAALAASRAKTVFLATMSHELRTPLNAIIGYGELLTELLRANSIKREAAADEMGMVLEAAYHLHELISDILDLSQIESGASELHIEQVPLRLFLRDLVQVFTPQAQRRKNSMHLHIEKNFPRSLFCDRTKLRQVLHNLLNNATKFTRDGEIHVDATTTATGVELRVRDTGIGIAATHLEEVFAPFTQVDSQTTRRFEGSGLGLTICRSYCHLLGGDIAVTSELGRGSTFLVTLPWCPPKPPPLDENPEQQNIPQLRGEGPVWVIDDDTSAHSQLTQWLHLAGVPTLCATTQQEVSELMTTTRPQAVVIDVLNHARDGLQILESLGKMDLQGCPIIVLSLFDEVDLCRRLGATAALRKPVLPCKLAKALAHAPNLGF